MKVDYTVTSEDYMKFNLTYALNSSSMKETLIVQRSLIPIIMIILAIIFKNSFNNFLVIFTGVLIVSVMYFIIYPKHFFNNINKDIQKNIKLGNDFDVIGNHSINIDSNGFVDSKDDYEVSVSWKDVDNIETQGDYIYIYNMPKVYIIPKTCFDTDIIMNEFIEKLKLYKNV